MVLRTEIGTLMSITILMEADIGETRFNALLPDINIPSEQEVSIRTQDITNPHKFCVVPMSVQGNSYTATRLNGCT